MSGASGNDSEAHSRASQSVSIVVPAVTMDNTSHNLYITAQKLNGKNFLYWSCSVALVIRGKGKIAFIDGSSPCPDIADHSYASWDANNSLVIAWLIQSMVDEIGETYLFHSMAKETWDAMVLAYSDLKNSSQLFEWMSLNIIAACENCGRRLTCFIWSLGRILLMLFSLKNWFKSIVYTIFWLV